MAAMRHLHSRVLCIGILAACTNPVWPAAAPPLIGGRPVPEDEGGAMDAIGRWLDSQQWSQEWQSGTGQITAFDEMNRLSKLVPDWPSLAIGLGQNIYSYFWFISRQPAVDKEVMPSDATLHVSACKLATQLHLWSIQISQCDNPQLPKDLWSNLQCTYRWRYVIMILSELGVALAEQRADLTAAATALREVSLVFNNMKQLPHHAEQAKFWTSPVDINTNAAYFPGPVNRPFWPTADVPIAIFLEQHAHVFREELFQILEAGNFEGLYWSGDEVSLTQFAPEVNGWMPLTLVKNKKRVEKTCAVAPRSCALLQQRPEVVQCSAKDAGGAFAHLGPHSALKPHFWTTPRLGVHLGLHIPPGGSMTVGGEPITWEEGKAIVFDDTYVHSAKNGANESRYVLVVWFCHPCDRELAAVRPDWEEPLCNRGA